MNARFETSETAPTYEARHWPVNWSAIFAGTLAAIAVALIAGLAGTAVGAQMLEHGEHLASWRRVHFGGIIWAVCSAFLSFVVGGWVAARITGHPRPETGMLHGAMAWLVAIPVFVAIGALGAGGYFGTWYAGLTTSPAWVHATPALPATEVAAIVRNNALGAITALILGLIGSVIGGWMASGHPMTFWNTDKSEAASLAAAQNTGAVTR
ncbi:MAG TPA: hypothetical protein VFE62_27170 [Gemmataceae bacterium]|nr:hypothetical protein [Gemmataceae bacterium]